MITRTAVMLAILSSLLGGCAAYHSDNAVVMEAWQEREAAYVRLAKAISHYCSVSTDSLDSRQACILERRLSLLQIEQPQLVLNPPVSPNSSAKR